MVLLRMRLTCSAWFQEQLEHFTALLNEIESQLGIFNSATIATTLSRAKLTIEQLHQLIQVKILQNVNGTSRARQRAWTRNKSKIFTIRDALKDYRRWLWSIAMYGTIRSLQWASIESYPRYIHRSWTHKMLFCPNPQSSDTLSSKLHCMAISYSRSEPALHFHVTQEETSQNTLFELLPQVAMLPIRSRYKQLR
jgi:hypothetical protein